MLRHVAIALLLIPTPALAQKTVSVGDDADVPLVEPQLEGGSTGGDTLAAGTTSTETQSVTGDSIVTQSSETELAIDQNTVVDQDTLVAQVITGEDGATELALTTLSGVGSGETGNHELGECNPGTEWQDRPALCWNEDPDLR